MFRKRGRERGSIIKTQRDQSDVLLCKFMFWMVESAAQSDGLGRKDCKSIDLIDRGIYKKVLQGLL